MSHSITGRARAIALTVAALVSVPVLASTAVAAPADMYAPYARAAAKVSAGGTLTDSKNVTSVSRPRAGVYCVKITDPDIDLRKAAVLATVNGIKIRMISVNNAPDPACGNAADAVTVYTFYADGTSSDAPFTLTVQ
ncbi:hypothetical protein ACN9M0_35770 [Streptomyces sp. R-07]|uniref:hypothetical protein n=1 Tax=unclassified Streptomyces TaxID=2593676 RepID=UPI00342CA81F